MSKLSSFVEKYRFGVISWAVTLILVAGMVVGALFWKKSVSLPQALIPIPTAASDKNNPKIPLPALDSPKGFEAIGREIQIKTNVPADKPRYDVEEYRVVHGDSVFAIAESFKLKPETILWANYDTLQDSPDSLRPGQVLKIPPTDGIYYQWKKTTRLRTLPPNLKPQWMTSLTIPVTILISPTQKWIQAHG